jgi:D-3-phosphoglycerate dehydrogenase
MSNYTIKRLNLSPYQDPEYNFWEKEMVNGLNLSYLSQDEKFDSAHGSPFVLISNTHTNWEEIPERALEQTKLIIHPNSGYDNYSLEFLRQWDIPIVLGNPIRSGAVANYILTSLFTHFNQLPKRHSWDNSRKWDRELLIQKNILIIGHGHIGKILEQTLKPVVAKILVSDSFAAILRSIFFPQ